VNRVHGFGAVGVAIDSAPTEGVKVTPLSEIKSGFPILKNPANQHRAVGFTPKQWHYVFEDESLALYERYHIPASGRVFWGTHSRTSIRERTTPTSTTTTTRGHRYSSSQENRITCSRQRWGIRT
jgi:hypothetical protein